MNKKVSLLRDRLLVKTEKLYTQQEVDTLLGGKRHLLQTKERQIKKEAQTADAQQRFQDKAVARLVKKSNRILLSISSHALPVDFFPDTLNIEEGRITVIRRHFMSSEIHSVDIRHISNVFINRTFLLSQLVIISKTYEENEIKIRNLRTDEAVYARRIIEGLRIFEHQHIDTTGYDQQELIVKLAELSTTEIVT